MAGQAEFFSLIGSWENAEHAWESVRTLSRLFHGPGDIRTLAALSRVARSAYEFNSHPDDRVAAAALARGALEKLPAAECEREVLAAELAFAEMTREMSAGQSDGPDSRLAMLSGLEGSRGGRHDHEDGDGDKSTDERFCDGDGCFGDVDRLNGGGGDGTGSGRLGYFPEAPSRNCDTLNSSLLHCYLSKPRASLSGDRFRLSRKISSLESGPYRGGRTETLEFRSMLGAALAYEERARALRGTTPEGDRDRRLLEKAAMAVAEPGDRSLPADLALARKLLAESSKELDRDCPASMEALEAKKRLALFLMGDSGPVRMLTPLPEEIPPLEDVGAALSLWQEIRETARMEGPAEDVMRPGTARSLGVEAALGAWTCRWYMGEPGTQEGLVREALDESGLNLFEFSDTVHDHETTVTSLRINFMLAEIARFRGDSKKALELHRDTCRTMMELLGLHDRLYVRSSVRAAVLLSKTGNHYLAATFLSRDAESLEKNWPLDPAVQELRCMAAAEFIALGEPGQAVPAMRRATSEMARLSGGDDPRLFQTLWQVGGRLLHARCFAEAEEPLRMVVDALDRLPPNLSPRLEPSVDPGLLPQALNVLGCSLLGSGNPLGAVPHYAREREIRSLREGPDSPAALDALFCEASARRASGEEARGLELHRQVLEARTRVLGPKHPDTLISRRSVSEAARRH
jgi:hypothetical protein